MQLDSTTFVKIRDLIYEHSGMFFSESKKYLLENRLQARLQERNCASYEEYYSLLQFGAWREKELSAMINLVVTTETFFYRDQSQLQAFTGTVVPLMIQANQRVPHLRIWSAACSTGDEPYTLAMLLLENQQLADWSIEILASDISQPVLDQAQRGRYGQYAIRHVPPSLLKKYFTMEDGQYVLSAKAKRLVKFSNINLNDTAHVRSIRGMDVIFCRNCLIYFDDKAKQRIIDNLYDCLGPNGFLVIGISESLHDITRAFKPVHANRSVVYQKI